MANVKDIIIAMRKAGQLGESLETSTRPIVDAARKAAALYDPQIREIASVAAQMAEMRERMASVISAVPELPKPEPFVLPHIPSSPETMRLELLLEASRTHIAVAKSQANLLEAQGDLLHGTVSLLGSTLDEQRSTTQQQRVTNVWMVVTSLLVAATLVVGVLGLLK